MDPLLAALFVLAWLLTLGLLLGLWRVFRTWQNPGNPSGAPGLLPLSAMLLGAVFAQRAWAMLSSSGPDFFGAKEAAAIASLGLAALWLGFSFALPVGSWLWRLLPGGTLIAAVFLLFDLWRGGDGILGNTGYDMQLLLPGAALGLLAWRDQPQRVTGILAFTSAALFACLAPVLGGLLVLLAVALLALAQPLPMRKRAAGALVLLLFASFALWLSPFAKSLAQTDSNAKVAAVASTNHGGIGVRLAIWHSLSPLLAGDQEALGAGQFRALYPPLRDPAEIEATTGGHTVEEITEVHHPHNDLLLVFAELGTLSALLFAAGLLLLAMGAVARLLRPTHPSDSGLAAGALTLILAGAFHAPLLTNPMGATLGGLLLGALARGQNKNSGAPQKWRRAANASVGLAALALLITTLSWRPIGLNQAQPSPELTSTSSAEEATTSGRLRFELVAARARGEANPSQAADWWGLALKLRPFSIEALLGRGMAHVRQGDLLAAQHEWQAAKQLDPDYAVTINNLKRLGADLVLAGQLESGLSLLAPEIEPNSSAIEALAADQIAPINTALLSAAAWLHGRELFEASKNSLARFELERAAQIAGHGQAPVGVLGLEIAVLIGLEGQVQEARSLVLALSRRMLPGLSMKDMIAQLPSALWSPARLLAPK